MSYFNAQIEDHNLRLNLYGPIGANPMLGSSGVTAAWVSDQILSAGKINSIDVYINSPGGEVYEGIAIYRELMEFDGQVNVFVMGIAASIASVIMMAGDQRVVFDGADVMIHQAAGMTFGTADDHLAQVKALRRLDEKIANIYAEATGGDARTIAELMGEETWFDGDDAIADGFATHRSPQEAVSPPTACLTVLDSFNNVPLKVAAWAGQAGGDTSPPAKEPIMADEQVKPEEEEVKAEAETEETPDEIIARLTARIAELEGEEEDKPEEEAVAEVYPVVSVFGYTILSLNVVTIPSANNLPYTHVLSSTL